MEKLHYLVYLIAIILGSVLTCKAATTYVVGDNAGWDISSDLDSWPIGKKFQVGDVLVFQYASSDSVSEVTKASYDKCNTTNVLKTYSNNGNTTVTLDRPGAWYFISGNRLYCLGGMKLALNVEQDDQPISPAGAPHHSPATLPRASSKSDNPSPVIPSSSGIRNAFASTFLCLILMFALLWVVQF